jgi:hypothetical protein
MIKNKRCVFVGGCPNIIGKGLGPKIDRYDIVIRSNGGNPVQDHLIKDYGEKCHVWAINNQYRRYMQRYGYQVPPTIKAVYKNDLGDQFNRMKGIRGPLMGPAVWDWILRQDPKELWLTGIDFMASKPTEYKAFDYPEYYPGYLPYEIQEEGNKVKSEVGPNGHDLKGNNDFIKSLFAGYPGKLKCDESIRGNLDVN